MNIASVERGLKEIIRFAEDDRKIEQLLASGACRGTCDVYWICLMSEFRKFCFHRITSPVLSLVHSRNEWSSGGGRKDILLLVPATVFFSLLGSLT